MLPRVTFSFPDTHTKHLFLQHLKNLDTIEIDPRSIQGSIENSETLMVGHVEELILECEEGQLSNDWPDM